MDDTCDWCGAEGHDDTVHPEAVAEAAAWASQSDEATWFPVGAGLVAR